MINEERDAIAYKLNSIFTPNACREIKSIWFAVAVQLLKVKQTDYAAIMETIENLPESVVHKIKSMTPIAARKDRLKHCRCEISKYLKMVVVNTFFEIKSNREKKELNEVFDNCVEKVPLRNIGGDAEHDYIARIKLDIQKLRSEKKLGYLTEIKRLKQKIEHFESIERGEQ